jgi:hypothetical protein
MIDMQATRRPSSPIRLRIAGGLPLLGLFLALVSPGRAAGGAGPGALAADAGTVYAIDGPRAAIVARRIEAGSLAPPRDIVSDCGDGAQPIAVTVVEGRLLAAVCRSDSAWTLRTWELAGSGPAVPLQTLPLGSADGSSDSVTLAASPTGAWLAIAGLPAPLPPVLRAAIAGRRVASPSARGCPRPAARPAAVAISPDDAVVLFEPAGPAGGVAVVFYGLGGGELLRLDAGLDTVRGAGFDLADGTLFVVGERTDGDGLWRLDAALANGRQAVRPVLVARLPGPRAMAVAASGTAAVALAPGTGTVELVDTGSPRDRSPERLQP